MAGHRRSPSSTPRCDEPADVLHVDERRCGPSWTDQRDDQRLHRVEHGERVGPSTNGFNGRLTQVSMNLPGGTTPYTCSYALATGCWFKIGTFTIKGQPTDTTTWSANILGDPVHLIE